MVRTNASKWTCLFIVVCAILLQCANFGSVSADTRFPSHLSIEELLSMPSNIKLSDVVAKREVDLFDPLVESSSGHHEESSSGHHEESSSGHHEESSSGHHEESSSGHEMFSSSGAMDMRPPCIRFAGVEAQSQINYVTAIISNAAFGNTTFNPAFKGLFSPEGAVYSWFDGSLQFRANGEFVNFTANNGDNADASALLLHMVAFLGPSLGCNATVFPSYNMTSTLYEIHRNMNFNQSHVDYFVDQLIFAYELTSGSSEESDEFRMFFSQFGRCAPSYNQTCNDMSCTLASNTIGAQACALLYPSDQSTSLCSKYTSIMSSQSVFTGGDSVQNERTLMNSIIIRAINGSSTSTPVVPGLFAESSPLLPWFNGSIQYRHDAPDYLTDKMALDNLILHFVSYFGDLLECGAPGWNSMAYGFNMGQYDMYELHRTMGIKNADMKYFLDQLQLSLESFSFSAADLMQVNTSTKIYYRDGDLRFGYRSQICGEADCDLAQPNDPMLYVNMSSSTGSSEPTLSICNTYFGNNTNEQIEKVSAFITLVLLGNASTTPPVQGVMANPTLKPFFDGSILYRDDGKAVDFTSDGFKNPDYLALADHFSDYFLRVFECEPSEGLPPINNPDLWDIHRNMKISNKEFTSFATQIVTAATATGFDKEHIDYLTSTLGIFGSCAPSLYGGFAQVCNANLTGADACPESSFALSPAECFAQYVGDSICARLTYENFHYADVQSQADFLVNLNTMIFNGTTGGFLLGLLDKNSTTLPYFNGTIKYNGNDTIDYTDYAKNGDLIESMLMKTYTHLGQLLGCSAPGFGIEAYKFKSPNQDLFTVHKGMNIDSTVFTYYAEEVILALGVVGANPAEINAVANSLGLYGKCGVDPNGYLVEICSGDGCGDATAADCGKYPGNDSDSSNKNKIIIAVCVSVGAVLLIAVAYWCYRKRSRGSSSEHESQRLMTDDSEVDTYRSTR